MDIRFISSMTPDDEARLAPAVVDLIGALLDHLPLTYSLRVETAAGITFQRTHATRQQANGPEGGAPVT